MKELIRLIALANRLDQRNLTKEADKADRIIRKMLRQKKASWPDIEGDTTLDYDFDDEDEDMDIWTDESDSERDMWERAHESVSEDESDEMFGGDGPSEDELLAYESRPELFDIEALQDRLQELATEMKLFSESLAKGQLTADDLDMFEEIKDEFMEVSEALKEMQDDLASEGYDE